MPSIPWYVSLYRSIGELIRPEKLPPLEVTSRPVAVKDIWGLYARDPRSRFLSVGIQGGSGVLGEARKAKYSGTVPLSMVVDQEGRARDIHVLKSLGMGLDEKAIEAVQKWKFKPGMKGGQAVNARAQIEVNFRLL
ncbi:MAG: energy transducer TonB [Bryobacteraceae bacterium]|jgi:TonB family protein